MLVLLSMVLLLLLFSEEPVGFFQALRVHTLEQRWKVKFKGFSSEVSRLEQACHSRANQNPQSMRSAWWIEFYHVSNENSFKAGQSDPEKILLDRKHFAEDSKHFAEDSKRTGLVPSQE